jgi:hypothetical protein
MPPDKTVTEKIWSKRLSVANLPCEMTEAQLQTLFFRSRPSSFSQDYTLPA